MRRYVVGLACLIPAVAVMREAPLEGGVRIGMLCVSFLFATGLAITCRVRLSRHAAVSSLLALACTAIDREAGLVVIAWALTVTASRLVLRRHGAGELWLGAVLDVGGGVVFGIAA